MTKQDFEIIADTIAQADPALVDHKYLAGLFADNLKNVNPRFDRDMFIQRATWMDQD